jgi:cyclopropane fatty-acyl-phospholipid synthase-like methyltransferase
VGAGDRVLEIGCGLGACAVRMAQLGASVVAITVSNEQLKAARERVKKAGVSHLVSVEFCDYRKAHERFGTFDKVLSCEMLEAVGHEHLHSFFETVSVCLKPMGIASIQVITLPDERYEAYCNKHSDFIRTYIFPGGHLPCLAAMNQISSENGLSVERCVDIGLDYALTLRLWRERMLSKRAQIRAMGYPERFIRMYEFYFAYCEAAFANLLIYDYQIAWRKSPLPRPDVPARIRARTRAEAGGDGRAAAIDPLTGVLLAVWLCLTGLLVATKPPIAIIPATIGGFIGLRATIASLLDIPDEKARMATALLAALVSFAGAASVLLHGLALVDGELHTFTQALLSPPHVTYAALLPHAPPRPRGPHLRRRPHLLRRGALPRGLPARALHRSALGASLGDAALALDQAPRRQARRGGRAVGALLVYLLVAARAAARAAPHALRQPRGHAAPDGESADRRPVHARPHQRSHRCQHVARAERR